ncbi:kinase-like domain-containing protein [Rhizophagus clarus]|uniref:Kinase-like domain-containing protein n=1 Tax=Rhizophagus clarus TaxID=94130 RepID=A0A8H3L0J9_9GLOM|nr:kinase-like domain-containing protein [Rhizophagus clarus]
MKLANTNDSFDPTPKLKSSPVPIWFISFYSNDDECIYCGEKYINVRYYYDQKYCKNLECKEHEISSTKVTQNIQECCRNCLEILGFRQMLCRNFIYEHDNLCNNVFSCEMYCKLCGELLYQENPCYIFNQFKLCSDCYIISSGCIESNLTKKPISIIYLPWWHNISYCICDGKLTFISDCQKYCNYCCIFYTGCRYCLITNIIFGFTNQSQCKKCKRVSFIDITNNISRNSDLDDFLVELKNDTYIQLKIADFADNVNNLNIDYFFPNSLSKTIYKIYSKLETFMEWIPYS